MDEKCHGNSIEIQAYITNRSKLGHRTKSTYTEIVNIYGENALCIEQFSDEQSDMVMGGSALKIDKGHVKESVKPQKAEVNIKELLENDVRYTLRKLA